VTPSRVVRLAVFCDYSYRVEDGKLYAELPFALFLQQLARHCQRLVLTGRLDPTPGRYPYLMEGVEYAPLPHYSSGAHLRGVMRAMPSGIARFWRTLGDVDVVWVLGPNPPQALVFALLSLLRRRRLVLGVRQDLPQLIRHRHPGKVHLWLAALALEAAFRLLSRRVPVAVVGPDLARRYRSAAEVHVVYVSLLGEERILSAAQDDRDYDAQELRMLSVGRLDPEKNPLLLADVLADATRLDSRWRLDVCGDGTLIDQLAHRLRELGVEDRAILHGHVPIDDGLWKLYRQAHALVHVSFTEGVPQVLLEAFAARLPVVATSVGGVAALVEDCGLLVAPNDAHAAAAALDELVSNGALRARLLDRASARVQEHTLTAECRRLATFLAGQPRERAPSGSAAGR
jgi:glycosyltransferase involved in cell wall biosynthesis